MNSSLSKAKPLLASLVVFAVCTLVQSQSETSPSVIQTPTRSLSKIKGRAIYADSGLPAAGAVVMLIDRNSARPRLINGMVTTEQGNFGLGGIPPGEYYFSVQPAEEFIPNRPNFAFPQPTGDPEFDASRLDEFTRGFPKIIIDGKNSVQLELQVPRRVGGVISGRITGPNSTPLANAFISVLRQSANGPQVVQSTRASVDGGFRISRLPAGTYLVRAAPLDKNEFTLATAEQVPGEVYFASAVDIKDAVPVTVFTDQETSSIDISLNNHKLARVSGFLRMRETGAPLAGVLVRLTGDGNVDHIVDSDADGRWSFDHVTAGKHTLVIGTVNAVLPSGKGPVFVHQYRELTVGNADIKDVVVELSKGGTISGTVMIYGNGSARPLAIEVSARTPIGDTQISAGARVSSDGSFVLTGVPLGEVSLQVNALPFRGYATKSIQWNGRDLLTEKLMIVENSPVLDIRVVLVPVVTQH